MEPTTTEASNQSQKGDVALQPNPILDTAVNLTMASIKGGSGTPSANTIDIGGATIKLSTSTTTNVAGTLVTMKKEARKNLGDDKKHSLIQLITKSQHTNFNLQAVILQNAQDIQDTYDLALMIKTLIMHFRTKLSIENSNCQSNHPITLMQQPIKLLYERSKNNKK